MRKMKALIVATCITMMLPGCAALSNQPQNETVTVSEEGTYALKEKEAHALKEKRKEEAMNTVNNRFKAKDRKTKLNQQSGLQFVKKQFKRFKKINK